MKTIKYLLLILGVVFFTSCSTNKLIYTKSGFSITRSQRKIQKSLNNKKMVIHHRPFRRQYKFNKYQPTMKKEGIISFFEGRSR